MSAIDKQLEYFKQNKESILKQYPNKVLVISSELAISTFEDPETGFKFGIDNYGYGNFMLKDCRSVIVNQVNIISPIFTISQI